MTRKRLNYLPKWEGSIAGWAIKFIKNNYWRVASQYEMEDLIQDAYLKFLICDDRYGHLNNPRLFMALFKKSLINHFNTLSSKVSEDRQFQFALSKDADPDEVLEYFSIDLNNHGYFNLLIEDAPNEIKSLLQGLLTCYTKDGNGKLIKANDFSRSRRKYIENSKRPLLRSDKRYKTAKRENLNEHWRRILNLDDNIDLIKMVEDYFSNDHRRKNLEKGETSKETE